MKYIAFLNISIFLSILGASSTVAQTAGDDLKQKVMNEMPYIDMNMLNQAANSAPQPLVDNSGAANLNAQAPQAAAANTAAVTQPVAAVPPPNILPKQIKVIEKFAPKVIKPIVWLDAYTDPQIDSDRIIVGDIFNIDSVLDKVKNAVSQFDLGPAPLDDKPMQISASVLLQKLQMGFPLYDFKFNNPAPISVVRKYDTKTGADIEKLVYQFEKKKGDNQPDFDITFFQQARDVYLKGADWQVEVSSPSPRNAEFRAWYVNFSNGVSAPKSVLVQGRVNGIGNSSNFNDTTTQAKTAAAKPKFIQQITPSMSKTASAPLAAEVLAPILVKKGSIVNLQFENSKLSINSSFLALDDGRQGDFIRVKNNSSGKIISAKVSSSSIVTLNNG